MTSDDLVPLTRDELRAFLTAAAIASGRWPDDAHAAAWAVALADRALAALGTSPPPPPPPPPQEPYIIHDLRILPKELRDAGFRGRDNALWYAYSRSAAGWSWQPGDDAELQWLKSWQDQLITYWARRCEQAWTALRASPIRRAIAVINDARDRCGRTLAAATKRAAPGDIRDRVSEGDTVPD